MKSNGAAYNTRKLKFVSMFKLLSIVVRTIWGHEFQVIQLRKILIFIVETLTTLLRETGFICSFKSNYGTYRHNVNESARLFKLNENGTIICKSLIKEYKCFSLKSTRIRVFLLKTKIQFLHITFHWVAIGDNILLLDEQHHIVAIHILYWQIQIFSLWW